MKIFTKDFYFESQGSQEKVQEKYDEYERHLAGEKPETIKVAEQLGLHDCRLLKQYKDGNDYVMEFDPSTGFCNTTKVVFKNAKVKKETGDPWPDDNCYWIYEEVYSTPAGYEIHALFWVSEEALWSVIISTSGVEILEKP